MKRSILQTNLVRRLLSGINVPMLLIDPKSHRVRMANPAFENLSGYTQKGLSQLKSESFFKDLALEKINAACDLIGRNRRLQIEEHECELVRKSGRKVFVNILISSLVVENKTYIVFSMLDLSQLKKAQKQREINLQEISQMSKLADIGMLAAGVAHELNNPLMIVQGFAENLDMLLDQKELNREELKAQAGEILRATDRMSRIISQMSRMVRSTDVKFDLVDLQEITQNVVRFINHELKYSGAELTFDFPSQCIIRCDPNQVEQVILNILSNAVHALNEVASGPRRISIQAESSSNIVRLHIWNNGPAIPKHIQDKIMTPFFTTKDVGKGTGLGLPVSFGIMKAHGGLLSFSSDASSGTKFTLEFPAVQVEAPIIKSSDNSTVLIVDDDSAALEVLASKITSFGYRVIKVRSGLEAFETIRHQSGITAVFTDLRMPDMDGLTLIRHIRQVMNPGPAIYAVTGFAVTQTMSQELRAAGVSGVLTKPINHNSFSAVMHELNVGQKKSA